MEIFCIFKQFSLFYGRNFFWNKVLNSAKISCVHNNVLFNVNLRKSFLKLRESILNSNRRQNFKLFSNYHRKTILKRILSMNTSMKSHSRFIWICRIMMNINSNRYYLWRKIFLRSKFWVCLFYCCIEIYLII